LESEDGALLEDVTITNITMRDNVSAPLFFRLGSRLRGPKESTQIGALRRISVNNLVSSNGGSEICSILSGIPAHALEDIHLSNIFIEHKGGAAASRALIRPPENEAKYPDPGMFGPMPSQGFFLRHIRNLEMSHIEVRPATADARPSFYLEDVNRADFFSVTAPTENPAFQLKRVIDLRIAMSRAAKDIQLDSADERAL